MRPNATRRRCRSSATRLRVQSTIGSTSPRCEPTKAKTGSRARLPRASSKSASPRVRHAIRETACSTKLRSALVNMVALPRRTFSSSAEKPRYRFHRNATLAASGASPSRNRGAACRRLKRASPTRWRHKSSRVSGSSIWSGSKTASFRSVKAAKGSRSFVRSPSRARPPPFASDAPTERSTSTPTAACRRRYNAASKRAWTPYGLA